MFFLAALMAAIMSSIDSGVHSVTTALVVDFRDRLFPSAAAPRTNGMRSAGFACMVVIIGAIAITLACFVGPLGNVFDIGKKLTSAFGGPLLAIFVLAFFSRRATWLGVLISVSLSTVLTLYLMYTQDWFSVWYWPIGFGAALLLGYTASLLHQAIFVLTPSERAAARVELISVTLSIGLMLYVIASHFGLSAWYWPIGVAVSLLLGYWQACCRRRSRRNSLTFKSCEITNDPDEVSRNHRHRLASLDRDQTIVVIPIAAVEQHGPHLPTGTDTIICTAVAEAVESRLTATSC